MVHREVPFAQEEALRQEEARRELARRERYLNELTRRTAALRNTAHTFCHALISPPPPADLISSYFTSSSPKITEHGPSWASSRLPFLGKTFSGEKECLKYFEVLGQVLEMQLPEDAFPDADDFIVDAEAGMVSVVGKGHFASKETGKGWDEQFIYRLSGFDEDGKIGHWEIWADPLSAWVAVGGVKRAGETEKDDSTEGVNWVG